MIKVAAILALPFVLFGAVASSSCLVVDVREGGPDGMHIVVPVAFALVSYRFIVNVLGHLARVVRGRPAGASQ